MFVLLLDRKLRLYSTMDPSAFASSDMVAYQSTSAPAGDRDQPGGASGEPSRKIRGPGYLGACDTCGSHSHPKDPSSLTFEQRGRPHSASQVRPATRRRSGMRCLQAPLDQLHPPPLWRRPFQAERRQAHRSRHRDFWKSPRGLEYLQGLKRTTGQGAFGSSRSLPSCREPVGDQHGGFAELDRRLGSLSGISS